MSKRWILFLWILGIVLIISSCSYILGPAGEDGQPKISNVVINLQINGSNSTSVYHNADSGASAFISWDVVSEVGVKNFELDFNDDNAADQISSSFSFPIAIPSGIFTEGSTHNIRVRSIDKNGTIGDWCPAISFIIDKTPPGAAGISSFTNSGLNQGTVIWSGPGAADLNRYMIVIKNTTKSKQAEYVISDNGATFYDITQGSTIISQSIPTAYNLVFSIPASDAGDTFSIVVSVYDHAGNKSDVTSSSIVIN